MARVHRIGQKKTVHIYRLVSQVGDNLYRMHIYVYTHSHTVYIASHTSMITSIDTLSHLRSRLSGFGRGTHRPTRSEKTLPRLDGQPR